MSDGGPDIAIIGLAGRFPGAKDLEAFWANLRDGRSTIRRLSDDELTALEVDPRLRADPTFVPVAAPLEDVAHFDAAFFGYSPREAEQLDPQQRLFLETAWAALESAGIDPRRTPQPTGVFAGATTSNYLLLNLMSRPELTGPAALGVFVNNTSDSLATRLSYLLDFKGPSFAVQSACSTSLLAVHLACQSLLNQECDLALAGGVSVNLAQQAGYLAVEGSILATDGVCRPFDERATGTVFGSGLGVVVLKRLDDARRDGDPIRAVLRGTAAGNDGHLKVGFTAPSVDGQAAVVAEALGVAGLRPDELDYVEAHGTGTGLGDPIEVEALRRALGGPGGARPGTIALGSVKGAIGHLDVAAGIAGLLKVVLALEHEALPPSVGYHAPNPRIDFERSPVRVNAALTPWRRGPRARRAGVSSFGFGGTNVHAVLEEAPPRVAPSPSAAPQLLVLSARTERSLEASTLALARHLEQAPVDLAEAAWTLQVGRHPFRFRRAVVASDGPAAAAALRTAGRPTEAVDSAAPAAFLFPGQGAQAARAGASLHARDATFRAAFDGCARVYRAVTGEDLAQVAFGGAALVDTAHAQPALFAVELALARWWQARGVRPTLLLGHSLGEYVAACLAGVFSADDAMALVTKRGQLMQALPRGAMLAVGLPAPQAEALATRVGCVVAAYNEPERCVLSGPEAAIAAAEAALASDGLAGARLATSHAFHSPMVEPMLDAFRAAVQATRRAAPSLSVLSNVTDAPLTADEATSVEYWVRHLREPVRFQAGLEALARAHAVAIEVGPGSTLARMARRQGVAAVGGLESAEVEEPEALLGSLGEAWTHGVTVDWASLHGERPQRVPLPTYDFEPTPHWVARRHSTAVGGESAAVVDAEPAALPSFDGCEDARGPLEHEVAAAWHELLGVSRLSVRDDFFELGGDSLLATQLVSRLRSRLGVEVPLQRLLEAPTIEGMAGLVVAALAQAVPAPELSALLAELTTLPPEALPLPENVR